MTVADIQHIQRELAITLPESYKRAVVPFRIPAMAGNTDSQLWDDAERLVTLNRELRAGSRFRPAWPEHLFAVGDPRGDEIIALDTRNPDGAVWWLDHGMVDHENSYESHSRFAGWVEEFYRDTRSDLEGDGFNVDGTPEALDADRGANANQSFFGCIAAILFIVLALVAFYYLRR
jgi:hypothetical protein